MYNTIDQQDKRHMRLYLVFALIATVPIWLAFSAYISMLQLNNEEAVATAATICFVCGIYIGRYLVGVWLSKLKQVTVRVSIGWAIFIIINFCWLFIHAEVRIGNDALDLLLFWLPFLALSFSLGILVKLVLTLARRQLREAKAQVEKTQSELSLLQAQVSPHFLFNTLNNLYGLSINEHERVPSLLLKLSELLRYTIYSTNESYVSLKEELIYIGQYVEFEKLRIGSRLELKLDLFAPIMSSLKIAPMLLIVFVENAFKHAKNTTDERIFISIDIQIIGDNLCCLISNSHRKPQERQIVADIASGFGLYNVKKRLDLLYPNQYEMIIQNEETIYLIELKLKVR